MAARSWCLWVWIKLACVLLLFSACLNTFFLYTYSPQKHQGHFFHSRPSILDHVIVSTVPMKRKFITPKQVECLAEWFCYYIVCLCFFVAAFQFLNLGVSADCQTPSKSPGPVESAGGHFLHQILLFCSHDHILTQVSLPLESLFQFILFPILVKHPQPLCRAQLPASKVWTS